MQFSRDLPQNISNENRYVEGGVVQCSAEQNRVVRYRVSNIRKRKYSPATTAAAAAAPAPVSRSGYPPWILKRGGLESSGRIPSS